MYEYIRISLRSRLARKLKRRKDFVPSSFSRRQAILVIRVLDVFEYTIRSVNEVFSTSGEKFPILSYYELSRSVNVP